MRRCTVFALAFGLLSTVGGAATMPQEILFVGPVSGSSFTVLTIRDDGSGVRELLRGGNSGRVPTTPRWSPDASQIVYDGPSGLVVIPAAGGPARQLTTGVDIPYAWSPDGRWIAFSRLGSTTWLYIVSSDGDHIRRLARGVSEAAWGPAAQRLLIFSRRRGLELVGVGGRITRVRHGRCASDPAWSPDGRWIAFARCSGPPYPTSIAIEHPDGTGFHWLTPTSDSSDGDWEPAWSPDGTKIAYTHARYVKHLEHTEIRVVSRAGRNLGNMDSYAQDHDERASWSPDGRKILFDRDAAVEPIGEGARLAVADAQTGRTVVIYEQPFRGSQSWRPH
jgi:Tol biopolymer transport system component